MKLVIVHYHLRPSGVRRIIELATPHLRRVVKVDSIVLACGESLDRQWNKAFVHSNRPTPVEFFVEPAFKYVSEKRSSSARLEAKIASALRRLLVGATAQNCMAWAHNLGIARNLVLSRALAAACEQSGIPLIAHHHDWWFDNRWLRWPEMQRSGARNLVAAARAVFPPTSTIRHVAINRADADVLRRHFQERAHWLPNLTERAKPPAAKRIHEAQRWLQTQVGDKTAPVWILPCRLLRRKNIAEALLLMRWLRPNACLVTTGGISSDSERSYSEKLVAATRRHNWPLRLGILSANHAHKPSVAELMAASECVMFTSVQEGFGLPYLEAAAAGRPLIARDLPNIAPDLAKFGFRFPQHYREVNIHTDLFDWTKEQARQKKQFDRWKIQLPIGLRQLAGAPTVLAGKLRPKAVPFSRLTLDAQLEVLAQPVAHSWELCAPLNPFLRVWQRRASDSQLRVARWPRTADAWLSGPSYAKCFLRILRSNSPAPPNTQNALDAQVEFFGKTLAAANNYPLLWKSEV